MTGFIIVKYAEMYNGVVLKETDSVTGSYTANECGVTQTVYISKEEAQPDLDKMREMNPAVCYGVVRLMG